MALMAWAIDVPHIPLQRDAILKNGANPQNWIQLIMNCSLKFDYMNKELLVIVNHHVTVNLISDWY